MNGYWLMMVSIILAAILFMLLPQAAAQSATELAR